MTDEKDGLKLRIRALYCESKSWRWFIPDLAFYSVMTEDGIRGALSNIQTHRNTFQQEEIAQKVFQQGRKIFGILVLLDQATYVSQFIEADELEDTRLPFKQNILINDIGLPSLDAIEFEKKQWDLLAPTFYRGTLNRRFRDRTILPFVHDEPIGKGNFGTVYETELAKTHQVLSESFPERVSSSSTPA